MSATTQIIAEHTAGAPRAQAAGQQEHSIPYHKIQPFMGNTRHTILADAHHYKQRDMRVTSAAPQAVRPSGATASGTISICYF